MKTISVILTFLFISISSISIAADQSHIEAALKYIEVKQEQEKNEKMLELVRDSMSKQILSAFSRYQIPEDKKSLFEKYMNRMTEVIVEEMSWDKLKDEFLSIYLEVYTENELRELIKLFESPIGKKYIEKEQIALELRGKSSEEMSKNLLIKLNNLQKEMKSEFEAIK